MGKRAPPPQTKVMSARSSRLTSLRDVGSPLHLYRRPGAGDRPAASVGRTMVVAGRRRQWPGRTSSITPTDELLPADPLLPGPLHLDSGETSQLLLQRLGIEHHPPPGAPHTTVLT